MFVILPGEAASRGFFRMVVVETSNAFIDPVI
jgi:hypothetical protein